MRFANVFSALSTYGATEAENYLNICWYEVYDWIAAINIDDTVVRYFTDQFLEFLEVKKMNLGKVTWEYS